MWNSSSYSHKLWNSHHFVQQSTCRPTGTLWCVQLHLINSEIYTSMAIKVVLFSLFPLSNTIDLLLFLCIWLFIWIPMSHYTSRSYSSSVFNYKILKSKEHQFNFFVSRFEQFSPKIIWNSANSTIFLYSSSQRSSNCFTAAVSNIQILKTQIFHRVF